MKALHFGAGNIGRGFIGKTLSESGFSVVFADINQSIIDSINQNKEYFVRIVDHNQDNITNVKNVSAIHIHDQKIIKIIASVNLITTAVGPISLNKIALIIAKGIMLKIQKKCIKSLNIIACENKKKASSFLKQAVLEKLSLKYHDYLNQYIGFVDCTIDTIIPSINDDKNNSLLVSETFKEWIVDITQFKGTVPKIIHMKTTDNLHIFIERKLFTLNTGHAVAAYLGLIKKYTTIREAILDEKIRIIVRQAMEESGNVLIQRYNFDENDHRSYINKIFLRFENPFISDSLERVARNPFQKLGKEERLIGPLLGSVEYQLPYYNLSKGIAAVLHYKNKNDLESMKIACLIKQQGIKNTLSEICHLSNHSEIIDFICLEYISILTEIF